MKKQLQTITNICRLDSAPFIHKTTAAAHTYSLASLTLQFFIFSFIGWVWEVLLHVYMDHAFINRGVMTGPWLPIYGSGGVLILLLLRRLADNPKRLFFSIMALCGVIEYASGAFLEHVFHAKWWDYSDMLIQLHGRVCLSGLLIFGFGGLLIIYRIAPCLDRKFMRMSPSVRQGLAIGLTIVFIGDMIFSAFRPNTGMGITIPR